MHLPWDFSLVNFIYSTRQKTPDIMIADGALRHMVTLSLYSNTVAIVIRVTGCCLLVLKLNGLETIHNLDEISRKREGGCSKSDCQLP